MANDRYRYDRDWSRDDERGRDWGDDRRREDEGYIARRGFGNERAGYDRDRSSGYDRDRYEGRSRYERGGWSGRSGEDRHGGGRERDFGDSAGYGTGGSARDWRDVMGEGRYRGGRGYGTGYDRSRDRGTGSGYGYGYGSGFFGRDEENRYGASDFGRGSRSDEDERGFFERAGDEIRSWFGDEEAERRRMRDYREGEEGYHRGRGPRNYQRSDDRIREDVNDRLTDDPHLDASDIEVTVHNREVTLTGHVGSRFEKRHAEDLAESVSGVAHVQNNIRVQQRETTGTTTSGTNTGYGTASGAGLNTGAASATSASSSTTETGNAARRRTSSTSGT